MGLNAFAKSVTLTTIIFIEHVICREKTCEETLRKVDFYNFSSMHKSTNRSTQTSDDTELAYISRKSSTVSGVSSSSSSDDTEVVDISRKSSTASEVSSSSSS